MISPQKHAKKPASSPNEPPTIGFFTGFRDQFFHLMWCGIADVARERNIKAISFAGNYVYDPEGFTAQANILYDLVDVEQLDGLIIWGLMGNLLDSDQTRQFYERYRSLPIVSVAQPMSGITSVLVDNYGGMREAIVHLIEVHGCRRIAYIKGYPDFQEHDDRYRAYVDALAEYGLPFDPARVVVPRNTAEMKQPDRGRVEFQPDWGRVALRRLLDEQHADFDALVTNDDIFVHQLLPELQARGIRVPDDIALVSFDDMEGSDCLTPPLTTVPFPMYELGRQAAATLLAKLSGQNVPEQVEVPARLTVRQSCGCLDPTVTSVVAGPVVRTGTTKPMAVSLEGQRERIVAEMSRAAKHAADRLEPGWAERLLDECIAALTSPVDGKAPARFLSTLERILRRGIVAGDDIEVWAQVLATLRRNILPYLNCDDAGTVYRDRAEDVWLQAQVMVGKIAQQAQAYRNLQADQQKRILSEIGAALATTFDVNGLVDILVRELPRLGISRGYLALYEQPQPYRYPQSPPQWSRLVLAYDEEAQSAASLVALEPGGRQFPSRQLVPPGILPQQGAYALVAQALYFLDEQIGFMVLDGGQRDGDVYDMLRTQISSALQGALLVQRVREHSAKIARQKYVLDTFIETVPDRIWFKDREGRFTRVNRAHARGMGLEDPREEIGKTDADFYSPNVLQAQVTDEQAILRSGRPMLNKEVFTIGRDGSQQWLSVTKMPLLDEHQNIIGTFGISRDITALKQTQAALERAYAEVEQRIEERTVELQREVAQRIHAEDELRSLNTELEDRVTERTATLEALNRELRDFAYVVSHDLKAPLRGIARLAHWLTEDYSAAFDDKGREMADLLVGRVKRLDDLIDGILQYSRIGRIDTNETPIDLQQLVPAVIDSLAVPDHIQVSIDSALPVVRCNMTRMTQVFQNLIGNAVKFLDSPQGRITIGCEDREDTWLFRVTDNGPGIDARHHERIFNIFQTLTARDLRESTGIGLALVKKIVELYGGCVWVESTAGEGATFLFTLPKKSAFTQETS